MTLHDADRDTIARRAGARTRDIAQSFVDALAARDFDALRSMLAQDMRFRMLLPGGLEIDTDPDAAASRYAGWFGDADRFELEASDVADVEGRLAVRYRFRIRTADRWQVIEQHLMLDLDTDGHVARIDLLCSGFRPISTGEADCIHHFDAGDLGCADGLAGEFRLQMAQIPVGEVLVVTARDPAAKADLPPLARMMGHIVRSIEAPADGGLQITVERGR
jgi:TusA-related sulfurtransferase